MAARVLHLSPCCWANAALAQCCSSEGFSSSGRFSVLHNLAWHINWHLLIAYRVLTVT